MKELTMTAKKITPANPDTLPATPDDKTAAGKAIDRKTAGVCPKR